MAGRGEVRADMAAWAVCDCVGNLTYSWCKGGTRCTWLEILPLRACEPPLEEHGPLTGVTLVHFGGVAEFQKVSSNAL